MNPLKVLLVDDSKSARYALRLQLQQHNTTVETADAAEAALEHVRESRPDVIFMDHTMPGMSGFEALDILKTDASTAQIPVVMCTSHEDPAFISRAKEKGAVDVLSKATTPERLGELLGRLQRPAPSPEGVAPKPVPKFTEIPAEEGFDERVRALIESLLDERLESFAIELLAKVDDRIHTGARAAAEPLLENLAKRLSDDLITKTDERIVSGLNMQAERLQEQFLKAQTDQAEPTRDQFLGDQLRKLLREHLEQERKDLDKGIPEVVAAALDALASEPSFLRRVSDATKAMVIDSAEQAAKRRAAEIAEAVVTEWTDRTSGLTPSRPKAGFGRLYLLSAGAALVGVLSAAVVFLILS